jgi:hypothetical protein
MWLGWSACDTLPVTSSREQASTDRRSRIRCYVRPDGCGGRREGLPGGRYGFPGPRWRVLLGRGGSAVSAEAGNHRLRRGRASASVPVSTGPRGLPAVLAQKPGEYSRFEAAFREVQPLMAAAKGYLSRDLQRCRKAPDPYLLPSTGGLSYLPKAAPLNTRRDAVGTVPYIQKASGQGSLGSIGPSIARPLGRLVTLGAYRKPPDEALD